MVEVVDFSQREANLLGDILRGTFEIVDAAAGTNESLDLCERLLDALENGNSIQITG